MALYGRIKDVNLVKSLNRELLHNIVEQQIGYYKPKIDEININLYGEAKTKTWIGPVLLQCFIDRGKYDEKLDEFGPDIKRTFQFKFLKDDLVDANVLPEKGDVVLWNEDFFEVDNVDQNRLFTGKDPDYAYSNSVTQFGSSLHIILDAHLSRREKLGISLDRL